MPEPEVLTYKCPECGAEIRRGIDISKVKVYCAKADKYVYMKKVKKCLKI